MTGPVWQGLDHTALHAAVVHGGLGPAVSMDAEQQWKRMGKLITEIEGRLSAAMRESESEWTGAAADATRTGISPLGRWAVDAAQDAANTAEAVTTHAYGAATLRSQLRDNPPVPPETIMQALERNATYGPQGATPADLAVVQADQARRDEAAAKAVADARVYENIGFESRRTLDFWSVPPTVTVEPAAAAAPGGGAGSSPVAGAGFPVGAGPGGAAEIPAGTAGGPSALGRAGEASVGGTGGAVAGGVPGALGASGSGGAGAAGRGPGGRDAGVPPTARTGPAAGGPGAATAAGNGPGAAGRAAPTVGRAGAPSSGPYGAGALPASPVGRAAPSPGGRGTGPGPWSRAAADPSSAGRAVVPAVPPRTPSPGWRSVLPPAEPPVRAPGEPAARPGGTGAAPATSTSGQGAGTRTATSHGMYPPMTGGGAGQGTERRRPSYLVDDSGAFLDRRWVQPAVISPGDLIPDGSGRLAGQDGRHE